MGKPIWTEAISIPWDLFSLQPVSLSASVFFNDIRDGRLVGYDIANFPLTYQFVNQGYRTNGFEIGARAGICRIGMPRHIHTETELSQGRILSTLLGPAF